VKCKEVMSILQCTRQSVHNYVKDGKIKVIKLPNGRYIYNKEDVYKLAYKDIQRKTYLYARVSTNKQKKDLENQVNIMKQFCFSNGIMLNGVYQDIASGIDFEKRKNFFEMLNEIIDGKVERVIITYKDRLSRVGFNLFKHLFKKYNCEILVISEIGSEKLDSEEIFEEIVSLLHCYSMKLYSKRKNNYIKKLIEKE